MIRGLLVALLLVAAPAAADRGADGRFDRRDSSHFALYQDVDIDRAGGWNGSVRFERDVLASLEQGYDQLDDLLGLRPRRRLAVWVYDPGVFDERFAGRFRFRVAGFYGDAIHVRGDTAVTLQLSRTLHHELVHAAMAEQAPSLGLPAWLNEGLAEWFESRSHGKRRLSAGEWGYLEAAERRGSWIAVTPLAVPSFIGLRGDAAGLAYLESYALVDSLARRGGDASVSRFLGELIRSRSVDRALRRVYRIGLSELEPALRAELR